MIVGVREKEGDKKPTRHYSKQQEKTVAASLNGRCTPNSGATAFSKGDVLLEDFLIECKTKVTHSDSISIKKEWIEKNIKESIQMGKPYNAIVFNFGPNETNYYIIDESLFKTLVEKVK